jgi:hypothetical protein
VRERGTLAGFVVGKTVLALTVIALIGAAVSVSSNVEPNLRKEKLMSVAESITGALKGADRFSGEVELVKRLPRIAGDYEVTVSGFWAGGAETITVRVRGEGVAEHSVVVGHRVNGGQFRFSARAPSVVRAVKTDGAHDSIPPPAWILPFWVPGWAEALPPPPPQLFLELR